MTLKLGDRGRDPQGGARRGRRSTAEDAARAGADPARGLRRRARRRCTADATPARAARPARRRGARGGARALRAVRRADPARAPAPARPRAARELMCACRACTLLFDRRGGERGPLPAGARPAAAAGRLRARRRRVGGAARSRSTWRSSSARSAAGRVLAFYPSPMGPTESLLELEAWERLEAANPVLGDAGARRRGAARATARAARAQHWLVPIDDCYALVGLIRTRWRGLTGGAEVWEADRGVLRGARPARAAGEPQRRQEGDLSEAEGRPARSRRPSGRPHARASSRATAKGNYEKKDGHLPDGRATAERSTGINAAGARADRPADAEPPARLSA